ncbi:hypothetical protein OOZ19_27335 [Saccharopolyspora sp. NFXS83]|uniref:hypothetical protein n=1 Tax=Saccharopolyspora sp. NFXS83 TaxID=2993560 RepID=UPI00224B7460|nr:hypothetical protein [Saccharopolyspora sp. NFXS83]MCX2733973.1 hypothetical protein [Saccharopolyspora sp. NFXS83]
MVVRRTAGSAVAGGFGLVELVLAFRRAGLGVRVLPIAVVGSLIRVVRPLFRAAVRAVGLPVGSRVGGVAAVGARRSVRSWSVGAGRFRTVSAGC